MLTVQEIQLSLNASRVVPLATKNAHGPLGIAQLAAEVAALHAPATVTIPIRAETWAKLQHLAEAEGQATARPVTAVDVAAGILERFVTAQTS